jgi:hypothetical protein
MNDRTGAHAPLRVRALLLIGAALSAPLHAQDDALVRWYDVRALEAAGLEDPHGVDLRLHLVSSYLDAFEPDGYDVALEDPADLDIDALTQLVLDGLGEAWPDDRVYADARAGRLRVEGTAETHAEVRHILEELAAHALETLEVEVAVLPRVPPDARAVLSAAEADALFAAVPARDVYVSSVRAGRRALVGAESFAADLMDYDVEVAQRARTPDPQVTVLRTGLHLGLVAQPRSDGRIFLRTWGRNGQAPAAPRRVPLAHFDGAPLELPTHATTLGVVSAVVPDGGGLVVGGPQGAGAWVVRVRRRAPAAPDAPFVPLADLTARPLVTPVVRLPRAAPSGGWAYPESLDKLLGDAAIDVVYTPEDVLEMLWDVREQRALGGSLQLVGQDLYVRGSADLRGAARELVERLTRDVGSETLEVDVRFGLLPPSDERAALLVSPPGALAARLPERLLGACRPGDTLLVVSGEESWYLQDHDFEIAEASVIPDPIIGTLFDGVGLWCLPNRVAPGRVALWVDFAAHATGDETRTARVATWEPRNPELTLDAPLPTGTFHATAEVELPRTACASTRSMLTLVDGEWALLCRAPLAGSQLVLVAVVRVSAP